MSEQPDRLAEIRERVAALERGLAALLQQVRTILGKCGPQPWEVEYERRLERISSLHPGQCQHRFHYGYCCNQAATEAGYCLTHDPQRREVRHRERQDWLCHATRKDGQPCRELRVDDKYCRHHQGGS